MKDKVIKILLFTVLILLIALSFFILSFIIKQALLPFIHLEQNFYLFITGLSLHENNQFGILFLIINTCYITVFTIFITFPVSIFLSIFLVTLQNKIFKNFFVVILELLQSIPSIIYGILGSIFITKVVYSISGFLNINSKGGLGVLSGIMVLTLMTVPSCSLILFNALKSIDKRAIDSSLSMGVSKIESYFFVGLKMIKDPIYTAISLIICRVISESTAISLVIGNRTKGIGLNFFDTSATLGSSMLIGLKESSGINYQIRFSMGLFLMLLILLFNYILFKIKKGFEHYE